MTDRIPLVFVLGVPAELPAADRLALARLLIDGTDGLDLSSGGIAASAFHLTQRQDLLATLPVPLLRPRQANQNMAFDICPNGTPDDLGNEGICWFDVCDTDLHNAPPNSPVAAARVGVGLDFVEFGSHAYGGRSPRKTIFGFFNGDYANGHRVQSMRLHPYGGLEVGEFVPGGIKGTVRSMLTPYT